MLRHRRRSERGSAIADFALTSVILVPLFFAIFQFAVIWHVRNTLTAAASEGARYGAVYNRSTEQGAERTADAIAETFGSDFRATVTAGTTQTRGQPVVEVVVHAEVPVLAFWGPTVRVESRGHAIKELLP